MHKANRLTWIFAGAALAALALSVPAGFALQDSKPAFDVDRFKTEQMNAQRERLRGVESVVPMCMSTWKMVGQEAQAAAQTAAELTLRRNGIRVRDFDSLLRDSAGKLAKNECDLRINVERLGDFVEVKLSLFDSVVLERDPTIRFHVAIWECTSISVNEKARLRDRVVELMETFSNEMLKAAEEAKRSKP